MNETMYIMSLQPQQLKFSNKITGDFYIYPGGGLGSIWKYLPKRNQTDSNWIISLR